MSKKKAKKKANPRPKAERKAKEKHPCACGCGTECTNTFAPGHDGRVHGWFRTIRSLEQAGIADVVIRSETLAAAYARWDGSGAVSAAFHTE